MSDTIENTKDLDASRTEALQGLLHSLEHTNGDPASGTMLTTEQRQKLSEKIHEVLGNDAGRELTLGRQLSQPLNEDGLPIIDIAEPVNGSPQTTSPSSLPEQGFTPFTLLPPDERERRRRERDRILDLLEEEERLQQLQEERNAEEERREAIRRRKESAKAELDRLNAARELQKKMGQALVQQARGAENRRGENSRLKHQTTSSPVKKSVSFVDAPVVRADGRDQQTLIPQPDWGEVTPGKLRAQSHVPLLSTTEAQKYPMKMRVVERHPTAPPLPFHGGADSDDESTSSAGHLVSCMENGSSDEEGRPSAGSNDLADDEPLEEELDYDTAQHHREIALEYHRQRHAISTEAASALAAHTLDGHEQQEPFQSDGQVPVSRFRANRMATAYGKSFGPISSQVAIPSSRQKYLRNSVRLGKLENNQLVGGDSGESGSEDETIEEVIQMLKMGGIHNVGPDLKLPSTFTGTVAPLQKSDAVESLPGGTSIPVHGARPSRFKLAHGGTPETTTFQDNHNRDKPRSQLTVSNVVERKSPRSLSSRESQRFPIDRPRLRPPVQMSQVTPPMIMDSPSFPMTAGTSIATLPSSSPRTTTTGSPSPHQSSLRARH